MCTYRKIRANTVLVGNRTLQALQTTKVIQAYKLSNTAMTAAIRRQFVTCNPGVTDYVHHSAASDPTCKTTYSDSNSVRISRPACSVDTTKSKEDEFAEVEKIAVEREYSLHQVKLFTQDLRDNRTLKNRLDSVKEKTRNTKLTKVEYNATSKQLLAKSGDFVFTDDCVKAVTLYWNIRKDKPDMTAAVESLLVIEEPTQVSRMHCRHEIEHVTKDLHAFMDLVCTTRRRSGLIAFGLTTVKWTVWRRQMDCG